jgi:hypothetical protein
MKIAAWVIAILLLVAGIAIFIEALTTTNSVWLSIPLLALSGVFTGPAVNSLPGAVGCAVPPRSAQLFSRFALEWHCRTLGRCSARHPGASELTGLAAMA